MPLPTTGRGLRGLVGRLWTPGHRSGLWLFPQPEKREPSLHLGPQGCHCGGQTSQSAWQHLRLEVRDRVPAVGPAMPPGDLGQVWRPPRLLQQAPAPWSPGHGSVAVSVQVSPAAVYSGVSHSVEDGPQLRHLGARAQCPFTDPSPLGAWPGHLHVPWGPKENPDPGKRWKPGHSADEQTHRQAQGPEGSDTTLDGPVVGDASH